MISLISIGVDVYNAGAHCEGVVSDLDYAVSDAERFAQAAKSVLAVKSAVTLIASAGVNFRASRINIMRSLVDQVRSRPKIVICYFAGHGVDVGGALHICPEDYDACVPELSSVPVSFFVSTLAKGTEWSLIILDVCRSDESGRLGPRRRNRPGVVYVADNVCVMLSCSNGESAIETPSVEGEPAGGLFTHFLCRRLLSVPLSARRLDLGEYFNDVQRSTSDYAATELDHIQTPRVVGLSPHDVYLLCARKRDRGVLVHPLMEATTSGIRDGIVSTEGPIVRKLEETFFKSGVVHVSTK